MNIRIIWLLLLALPFAAVAQPTGRTLLTIGGTPITADEFEYLYRKNNQNLSADSLKKTPEEYLQLFINYKLKVMEAESLGMDTTESFRKEFAQYRDQLVQSTGFTNENLLKEFHDATLLFNLTKEKIWNKTHLDSAGFEAFCLKNKGLFKWGPRFDGWLIRCKNQAVYDYIDQVFAADDKISQAELEDLVNLTFPNGAFIQNGIFARNNNELVDYLVWDGPKPADFADGLDFVRGNLLAPSAKTADEAQGLYMAAYQNFLEEQWIKQLRRKYPVKTARKALQTIETVK